MTTNSIKEFIKFARDFDGETVTKGNKTYHNGELVAEYIKIED